MPYICLNCGETESFEFEEEQNVVVSRKVTIYQEINTSGDIDEDKDIDECDEVEDVADENRWGIFSILNTIRDTDHKKAELLYVIPFSLIYFPIYSITAIIGFAIGIARYRSLEKGGRAW